MLFTCIFAQESQSREEFFREFYGTFINSSDIEISTKEEAEVTPDLTETIKQLEERYDIDIPESEKENFKTAEDVAEYVNRILQQRSGTEKRAAAEEAAAKKQKHSWKMKLYGAFGAPEPAGLPGGTVDSSGFNGNLVNPLLKEFNEMYTWEAGIAFHPYGWNGRERKSHRSWGFAFDYARFDHGSDNDSTFASRLGISMNFQQDLTGRNKARPKAGLYLMESLRVGVHSFENIDAVLKHNNHLSYGVGLAQGIYFYIFDLKFYQHAAYGPDLVNNAVDYPVTFLESLYFEFGLNLGIALKF